MVIIIIVNSLFITVLSSQVSEMHAMCWLDPIHSGLGLSNFGRRLVELCEINYLGSSLIDFCISTGKHS